MTLNIGDSVVIEDVAFGSHDVIGMTGELTEISEHGALNVRVEFVAGQFVNVPATHVRPA